VNVKVFFRFFQNPLECEDVTLTFIPGRLGMVFPTQIGVRFPLLGTTIENEGASQYIAVPANGLKPFPGFLVYLYANPRAASSNT
jgi:hypothetical protein